MKPVPRTRRSPQQRKSVQDSVNELPEVKAWDDLMKKIDELNEEPVPYIDPDPKTLTSRDSALTGFQSEARSTSEFTGSSSSQYQAPITECGEGSVAKPMTLNSNEALQVPQAESLPAASEATADEATMTAKAASMPPTPKPDVQKTKPVPGTNPSTVVEPSLAVLNAMSEQDAKTKFNLYLQRSNLKENAGNFAEATKFLEEALKYEIISRGETHHEVAKTYRKIGKFYLKQDNHNKAIENFEKELSIHKAFGETHVSNPEFYWDAYDTLAQCYGNADLEAKAIENYELAIQILNQSTNVPPERLPQMHNNVGNSYRLMRNLPKAREHLEKAREMMVLLYEDEKNESRAKVHASLADVYLDLNLTSEAITELEASLVIRQENEPGFEGHVNRSATHQTLVRLYRQQGDEVKARRHEEIYESVKSAVKSTTVTDKDNYITKGAASVVADEHVSQALRYQRQDNSREAVKHYELAIKEIRALSSAAQDSRETQSKLAKCHNNVSNAYKTLQQYNKSETHIQEALRLHRLVSKGSPNLHLAITLFNYGDLLQRIGGNRNCREAIKQQTECLEMYMSLGGVEQHTDTIISLYRSLGQNYEATGDSSNSTKSYEKAKALLEKKGGNWKELQAVCNNLGNAYETLENYEKAAENLQMALQIAIMQSEENSYDVKAKIDIAGAHNNLGILHQSQKQLTDSERHFLSGMEILIKLADSNHEAATDLASIHHNIGNTYRKMHEYHKSLSHYQKCYEMRQRLGTDNTDIIVSMSQTYLKMGDTEQAEKILELNA